MVVGDVSVLVLASSDISHIGSNRLSLSLAWCGRVHVPSGIVAMTIVSSLPGYACYAEDAQALLRCQIASEGLAQEELQRELAHLHRGAQALEAKSGAAPIPIPTGCSEPVVANSDAIDRDRFVLLASFRRSAPVAAVAVSSADMIAAAAWDASVSLFDLPRWSDSGYLQTPGYRTGDPPYVSAAFMPTPDPLLGLASDCRVELWATGREAGGNKTLKRETVLKHSSLVSSLDFHSTLPILASAADDGDAFIWDLERQERLRTISCSVAELSDCCFFGGSGMYDFIFATSCFAGNMDIWDLRCPERVRSLGVGSALTCLDCHAGSHLLAAGGLHGQVCTWDLRTWKELRSLPLAPVFPGSEPRPMSLAASPCGACLAVGCADGELVIFDLHRESRTFKMFHHFDAVTSLAWGGAVEWASAADFLACASLDGGWSCWARGSRSISNFDTTLHLLYICSSFFMLILLFVFVSNRVFGMFVINYKAVIQVLRFQYLFICRI